MRFTIASALVVLSSMTLVASSSIYGRSIYPDCANSCIATADVGTCGATDNTCLCKSYAFVNSTTECFKSSCDDADYKQAVSISTQLCNAVGVTASPSPPVSSTSGATSSASSVSSTPASSSTSTAPSTSASATTDSNGATSQSINGLVVLSTVLLGLAFL